MSEKTKRISRRDFLTIGAEAAVGAFAAALASRGGAAFGADNKRAAKIQFGFTTYQWGKDWDIPTLIANCRKAAVFGVELRTSGGYAHGVELDIAAERRREVKKQFEDSPIRLVGLATSERFDFPDPAKVSAAIENAKGFIKLCHDVGGSGVRVFPNDFHKEVPREKTIAQIAEALNVLGAFAADYGQQVRLEAHGSAGDLPSMRAIMNQVKQPAVGVALNSSPRDTAGKGFEHNFNLVKDRLASTLHLHDLKDEKFPYQLQTDLLVKMRWNGWALLEMSDKVPDRVRALIEQREIFGRTLAKSLAA